MGLKSFLTRAYKKLQSEKILEETEKKGENKGSGKVFKREKNYKEKKKNKIFRSSNITFSIIFLIFTLISLFSQRDQDLNFFMRTPLEEMLSERPKKLFNDTHISILNDFLARYDFIFDTYRNLINGVNFIDNDLVPVSTFQLSISITSEKNCSETYNLYTGNKDLCPEGLYYNNPSSISDFREDLGNYKFLLTNQKQIQFINLQNGKKFKTTLDTIVDSVIDQFILKDFSKEEKTKVIDIL